MSLNKTQIDALIDRNCKTNSSSYPIIDKTADENLAIDTFLDLAIKSSGKWQWDDSNHTDYPIITSNINSGQRDYSFTVDEAGNIILDIFKVMIKQGVLATDRYVEIKPVDQQSDEGMTSFYDGTNASGIPTRYDKTANGIFLDCVPNYTVNDGLKIYINREASYFVIGDTTKKPGFAGLFHEYIALRPSYQYAYRNGLANMNILKAEMIEMERKITKYYSNRSKDEQLIMRAESINSM